MKQIAIYPGSFDPLTNGHLDIIQRSSKIFQQVIVAVFCYPFKEPMFNMEERVEMLHEATRDFSNITIDSFEFRVLKASDIRIELILLKIL